MAPSTDATTVIRPAQKAGIVIHTIYAQGAGHFSRNAWVMNGSVNGLAQASDETGGESFFLLYQNPRSFKPYFDQLQGVLNNQYWLGFETKAATKPGPQATDTSAEVSGAEIVSARAVCVTASE